MKNYDAAVEWLEQGRSIVWKQMLQLRTPVDDLSAIDPTLAEELKQVAYDLESATSRQSFKTTTPSQELSLEQASQQHRRLAESWEDLLTRVRHISGFGDFLRPKKASDLVCSAQHGDVVMINAYKDRCDALVIRQGGAQISHVPLPRFSLGKAVNIAAKWELVVRGGGSTERAYIKHMPEHKENLGNVLGILWEEVAKPVIEFLGYTVRALEFYYHMIILIHLF